MASWLRLNLFVSNDLLDVYLMRLQSMDDYDLSVNAVINIHVYSVIYLQAAEWSQHMQTAC